MSPETYIVIGLGFGDEGKGTITDYLVRTHRARSVVRFNGGPQAAHHVISPEGLLHCFAQFGSGTLVPGVETHLSEYMLVEPINLLRENEVLQKKGVTDALDRITIDPNCLVVTPFQKFANRLREIERVGGRHGSCGLGVGETFFDAQVLGDQALRAVDLLNPASLKQKLQFLQQRKVEDVEKLSCDDPDFCQLKSDLADPALIDWLLDAYREFTTLVNIQSGIPSDQTVVFEGAQGVLLDREYGFWPHVTKTRTTFQNALSLCDAKRADPIRVGVLRAYHTRHGAGPFVTEDLALTRQLPDHHNGTNLWQSDFRVGWFDSVMARYALEVAGGVDQLVITNLDRLFGLSSVKVCTAYEFVGGTGDLDQFFEWSWEEGRVVITQIKVSEIPSRDHQSQLTHYLSQCRPIYETVGGIELSTAGGSFPKGASEYLMYLQNLLQQDISLVSIGPTAKDKINL